MHKSAILLAHVRSEISKILAHELICIGRE